MSFSDTTSIRSGWNDGEQLSDSWISDNSIESEDDILLRREEPPRQFLRSNVQSSEYTQQPPSNFQSRSHPLPTLATENTPLIAPISNERLNTQTPNLEPQRLAPNIFRTGQYASVLDPSAFLRSHGPQSMRDPERGCGAGFRGYRLLRTPTAHSERRRWLYSVIRNICTAAAVILILLFAIALSSWRSNPLIPSFPSRDGPVTSFPVDAPIDRPDASDGHPRCAVTSKFANSFDFSGLKAFTLRNLIVPGRWNNHYQERVYGSVRIHAAPKSQKEDIKVNFSFDTNDATLQEYLSISTTESEVIFDYPTDQDVSSPPPQEYPVCIHTHTDVYIRPELVLENLQLESRIISIHVQGDIGLSVSNSTDIRLTAGTIAAEPLFKSRNTHIEVWAGSVYGTYPLFDVLSVKSGAGGIAIDTIPQPADRSDPQPARLTVQSGAGSIRVNYPPDNTDLPDREYRTDIVSQAGSISGRYLHGSNTEICSTSGRIDVEILPFAADDQPSTIVTNSNVGSQDVRLLNPYKNTQVGINRLNSEHTSQAASINVKYPAAWTGNIDGESTVGSVTVDGQGVEIIKREKRLLGTRIEAVKGNGKSAVLAKTSTGSVTFAFGG